MSACQKVTYDRFDQAEHALRAIRARARRHHRDHHGLPVRAYRCPDCKAWHLTSTPARYDASPYRRAA